MSIAYTPQEYDLIPVGNIRLTSDSESYLFAVWKDEKGMLYWAVTHGEYFVPFYRHTKQDLDVGTSSECLGFLRDLLDYVVGDSLDAYSDVTDGYRLELLSAAIAKVKPSAPHPTPLNSPIKK